MARLRRISKKAIFNIVTSVDANISNAYVAVPTTLSQTPALTAITNTTSVAALPFCLGPVR